MVYGVTQPWKAGVRTADVAAEVKQGKNIIDACKQVETTLVLSTQINFGDQPTGLPHADSKLEIEAYARGQRLRMVNVRPAHSSITLVRNGSPCAKERSKG